MTNRSLSLPEISGPYSIFLSDLHLSDKTPEFNAIFSALLASDLFKKAEAFYLLGDLFDFWLGDDLLTDPVYGAIGSAIAGLSASGVPCFFQQGNRDFLVGNTFCEATGMTAIDDPAVIDLYGTPTLLSHGDQFCTSDLAYQAFRKQIRDPQKKAFFLSLPLAARLTQYQNILKMIGAEKFQKNTDIMDVELSTVERYVAQLSAKQVIHGHTHRPDIHQESFGPRAVIADWRQSPDQVTGGLVIATPRNLQGYPITCAL